MKKRVAVLGATGSIGQSALDVLARDPDNFEVVLLTAHSRKEKLDNIKINAKKILTQRHCGTEELLTYIKEVKPDITINGISGAAGLEPSIAAIEAGSALALANKETIVMAGELVLSLAKEKNVKIIPVDSEHSAIFHLLEGFNKPRSTAGRPALSFTEEINTHYSFTPCSSVSSVVELILTASGGPFRNYTLQQMEHITVEDALAHPTWNMGPKITIDSASMANKGLEIIEACTLFNIPQDKVKVAVHPQSIIHSMIRLSNGAVYAQASRPDMRNPIADALYWPQIPPPCAEPLSFDSLTLEFSKPDTKKFPMLTLARQAAKQGGLYPCAYNAANEEAVSAFTKNKCRFLDIPKITGHVLEKDWNRSYSCISEVIHADKNARLEAVNFLDKRIG